MDFSESRRANPSTHNGRVDIKSPDVHKLFALYDKIHPQRQCVSYRNATDGLWENTALSDAFFSVSNIQILQNGIRAGVYHLSKGKYVIGPQDCDVLKTVMRSVFLQNAANQPRHIPEQIHDLNQIVLNYCTQQVYGEAQGYLKYIDDVSTLVVPIAHPVMANTLDRNLEFKTWF
jgi:hypothetical protein